MIECVVNISEGQNAALLSKLTRICEDSLLDIHTSPHHNRSVFTLGGEHVLETLKTLMTEAISQGALSKHRGVHPRLGIVDVVPFVALGNSRRGEALELRDRFVDFAAEELGVPCFLYGEDRSLPYIRQHAFVDLLPDRGPSTPDPDVGACVVGERPQLVAYNLILEASLPRGKEMALQIRRDKVRTLTFDVGGETQLSTNLIDPIAFGPFDLYRQVAKEVPIKSCELVGLVTLEVLQRIPKQYWRILDLDWDKSVEARVNALGQRN